LDRDVEVILLKCLEKDAERRYQSAGELARDIQRHLKGEPIEARPASSFYQLRKFVRRNKAAFGAIAATFVILLTGVIVSTTLYVRAEHALVEKEEQRKLADERAKQTNEVADFQSRMLTEIDVDAMGGGIKRRMRDQVRVATERQWVGDLVDRRLRTPDEVSAELAAFDERLTAAQGADVARGVLDEFVLTRASHAVEQQFKNQPLVQARLSNAIGETYQALGLLDAAERALRSALEIRRRVLGNEHPDTLTSISNLGELLRVELKVVEASRLLREALETRRRVLGETHPDTLESIQRMGWLQTRNGLPQAEPYFRKALEHRRQVLGNEHPDTLDSINDMGWLLYQQGKYTEAEPYWREAMETRRRVLGDEHLQTLDTMANMGALLMEQGKLAEAEPYLLEALEKTRRTQGDEHQATVDSIRLLGFLRVDQNRFKEAEALFTEAMAIYRRTLPAEGSQLAAELNQLAVDFLTIMAFARAEALLRESLDIFDRLSQGGNPPPWPRDVTASRLGEAIVGRVKHELEELASKEASVSQLCEAETLLLEAWEEMKDLVSRPLGRKVENLERIVGLYETWDAAEPGKGYDAQAAEWRAKLDEFTSPAKSASP
jgi:tetratricopeptide (TPR) repeat protein